MDKLVSLYSRPPHKDEFYSEQEQRDLTENLPPLSLKFDLPPIDDVSCFSVSLPGSSPAGGSQAPSRWTPHPAEQPPSSLHAIDLLGWDKTEPFRNR